MNIKLISFLTVILFAIGSFLSKFKRKKSQVVIYGGEDERKIHLEHEKINDEIKEKHAPINSRDEALKELNRYSNID